MTNSNKHYKFGMSGRDSVTGIVSDDLHANVEHNMKSNRGDAMTCKRCGITYVRGLWDFHHLCSLCFRQFDEQKMQGRINYMVYKIGNKDDWFESSDEWMEANPA